jgi:hypothetical protein
MLVNHRKFTRGYVFTLSGRAICWKSIKQSCIVDFTMEAEYVATCETTKEVVWLKEFLTDLGVMRINSLLSRSFVTTMQ